ncbi:hypothetical protein Tco_0271180 [Tanacetum coccineum]
MFDRAFKRVNTFEDFRTELVEGKEKRAGEELMQENAKKQNVEDDKETAELKQCLEIIPNEEEVKIDAIPLAVKSPSIVGWKIHKEGRKSYYQIMRVDRKSQMYMIFSHMLKSFIREDLEDLYKLVKAKYKLTRPVEDMDFLLLGDLKTMFEPHVKDIVWRNQLDYKVLDWKMYDSCRVHSLRMQHVHIHMLVEKKYPLIPFTLSMMLEKKLQIDYKSEMAYQLLKFIVKQLKKCVINRVHNDLRALVGMLIGSDADYGCALSRYVMADGAQSSRVPVPLSVDPYVVVRHAQLLDTDTESDPEEDTEEEVEDESQGLDDESQGLDDESQSLDDERQSLKEEGPGIEEEEEAAPEGQQQAIPVVDTPTIEPLGLGYGAARCRTLESTEKIAPSTYKVGQSSWSVPEQEGVERISKFRQPTLVTWVDPKDGRFYTDILTYAPPAALVQTPPSPEWSLGSLLVSPSSLVVPSPIASPVATPAATISVDEGQFIEVGAQLELHGSILHDHTQHLDTLPPTLVTYIDRDVRELYTRSGAVKDEIFSQRLVLALEAWAGHVDTRIANMSRARYDDHRLIHDMLVQQAAMQSELQEIRGRVTALEQEKGHREP